MATAATFVLAAAAPAVAAPQLLQAEHQAYDLKAQPLATALSEVARISGRPIVVSTSLARGKIAPALKGRYTPDQAYAALLSGSGLKLVTVGNNLVVEPADTEVAAPNTGESQAGDAEQVAEVVVTGTLIRGAAPVGSNLIAIGREDIDQAGQSTAQQILAALPQNFAGGPGETTSGVSSRNGAPYNTAMGSGVNLRGLGSNSTLVLINGARPAGGGVAGIFADISIIPASVIERVEVLADGASATYGSDAVAGVVNFIMRDRFDGLESRLRYSSADGDARELQGGILWGRHWASGRLVAAYEYYDRNALDAADRKFAREDLRPFGAADYRRNYAAPGTIVVGGQAFALPPGQNGQGLTASQLTPGVYNKSDAYADTDLLPQQRRHSVYASAEQDLGPHTRLFAQAMLAQRQFDQRIIGGSQRTVSVPRTNAFYFNPLGGTGPVSVQYDFRRDLGAPHTNGRVRAYNALLGLTRDLGEWSVTFQGGAARQAERYRIDNYGPNSTALAAALADSNPATAYNVFGAAGSTAAATRAAVTGWFGTNGRFDAVSTAIRADGPLLNLPAGVAKLAVGAEWRSERYRQTSISFLSGTRPTTTDTAFPGTREIAAAYAELHAPLIDEAMNVPGFRSLALAVAGRVERYSDVGSTGNPKVGLDWKPVADLSLRATYGKSFRAPSFQDLRSGPSVAAYQPLVLTDPNSQSGTTTVLSIIGNSPDMGPERATTWTAGLTYTPRFAPGLTASATYYDINYRDRIANVNANVFNLLIERNVYGEVITDNPGASIVAAYYASPLLYNPSNIPASSIAALVDLQNRNLSSVRQRGLDIDLTYRLPTPVGDLLFGADASKIFSIDQRVTSASPVVDVVGTVGNPVDLRVRGRVGWSNGPWSASAFVNYTDGYQNQTVSPRQSVKSWTTIDAQLAYQPQAGSGPWAGVRVAMTASNLFDRDPPFVALRTVLSAIGYDGEKADPTGRRLAIEIVKSW
ncbi:TonB-dependent receptor [Caulobacter flavus]|jgi:iron complex outermembrane receptor protein|nr:TonB-dependent receptor [Caulobacter flavus]